MITSTDNTDVIITRADGRVARPRAAAVSASIDLDEAPSVPEAEAGEAEAELEATTFV